MTIVGWHRHRWTHWNKPFQVQVMVRGFDLPGVELFQDRRCVRCEMVQRREVKGF